MNCLSYVLGHACYYFQTPLHGACLGRAELEKIFERELPAADTALWRGMGDERSTRLSNPLSTMDRSKALHSMSSGKTNVRKFSVLDWMTLPAFHS